MIKNIMVQNPKANGKIKKMHFFLKACIFRIETQIKKSLYMGKISKPNTKYAKPILDKWQEHGGLILQSETSRILGVTETQISNLAKKGNLFKINGTAYIGYTEMYKIYKKRGGE